MLLIEAASPFDLQQSLTALTCISLPRIQSSLATSIFNLFILRAKKVQVGKDQEKAQSEKDSHSKNRDGKKTN